MKIIQVKEVENLKKYDTVVLPYFKNEELKVDKTLIIANNLKSIMNSKDFKDNTGEIYTTSTVYDETFLKLVFLEVKKEKINIENIFAVFAKGFKKARQIKSKNVLVMLNNLYEKIDSYDLYEKMVEASYLSNYVFDKYKTKTQSDKIMTVDYLTVFDDFEKALIEAKAASEGTILCRDLVNEPPMRLTPEKLGEEAVKAGKSSGFKVTVFDKEEIEELNMNAFLSVGKGSVNTPKLIVMEYKGSDTAKKIGLIGKGLTYDSGGYSIKPSKSMSTMHSDMAGAASAIGAMKIIASMKLKVNIVAVVAACENRISHEAYLPGDILESMSGKFIEVNNTDAEGRLTLADAVTYIKEKHKVESIVDFATLTGSIITALGKFRAGTFSNNDQLHEKIEKASHFSGEKIWRLPCDKELRESINSDVADIRNSTQGSTIGGGSITAALFIKEFVEDTPWVHIDIAGTSWTDKSLPYSEKGGVGYGARLIYHYAKLMENEI